MSVEDNDSADNLLATLDGALWISESDGTSKTGSSPAANMMLEMSMSLRATPELRKHFFKYFRCCWCREALNQRFSISVVMALIAVWTSFILSKDSRIRSRQTVDRHGLGASDSSWGGSTSSAWGCVLWTGPYWSRFTKRKSENRNATYFLSIHMKCHIDIHKAVQHIFPIGWLGPPSIVVFIKHLGRIPRVGHTLQLNTHLSTELHFVIGCYSFKARPNAAEEGGNIQINIAGHGIPDNWQSGCLVMLVGVGLKKREKKITNSMSIPSTHQALLWEVVVTEK